MGDIAGVALLAYVLGVVSGIGLLALWVITAALNERDKYGNGSRNRDN
jgi:hypothetical protein